MNGVRGLFLYLCLTMVIKIGKSVEEKSEDFEKLSKQIREVDIFRGIKLLQTNDQLTLNVRMFDLFGGVEARSKNIGEDEKLKKNPIKKIGAMMMMVPFVMQLFSLPGALASIKMSLLRSIFVGKLALIIMFVNALRSSQTSEVVVVHQPQHHQHYYNDYHLPEDDDEGWWGR